MISKDLTLTFVGDILPSDRYYTQGFGIGSVFSASNGNIWLNEISKLFDETDIGFGNLEAPLLNEKTIRQISTPFMGSENFAIFLKKCGLNVLSIANNHILEHGEEGYTSTCRSLNKAGLQYVGSLRADDTNFKLIQKKGIKIAIASFNEKNDLFNPGLYAELNDESLNQTLEEIKSHNPDIIIYSLHWGNEYIHIPSYKQIVLARKLIEKGVNIIIGHHPHVIQPVERFKGGLIIYSLGNFLFGANWSKKVQTGMACKITFNNNDLDYTIIPVFLDSNYKLKIGGQDKWFVQTLNRSSNLMSRLLTSGEKKYNRYYFKNLRKQKLMARLLMKLQLLKEYKKLDGAGKNLVKKKIKRIFGNI